MVVSVVQPRTDPGTGVCGRRSEIGARLMGGEGCSPIFPTDPSARTPWVLGRDDTGRRAARAPKAREGTSRRARRTLAFEGNVTSDRGAVADRGGRPERAKYRRTNQDFNEADSRRPLSSSGFVARAARRGQLAFACGRQMAADRGPQQKPSGDSGRAKPAGAVGATPTSGLHRCLRAITKSKRQRRFRVASRLGPWVRFSDRSEEALIL